MKYNRNYSLTEELREILKTNCPEAFQDGQLNIDVLKAIIGEKDITENSQEHFELSWVGKRKARKLAAQAPIGALVPQEKEGVNQNNTKNIFIEGENLEVLRLLRQAYKGKIKMIYIDPPYNTGNDFVYKDNFAENKTVYLDKTGENLVSNPKSQGRFHANWLNFMYPRLRIAKDLLHDEGVIFVSLDDNEINNLRLIMDEIFGPENFIEQIIWTKNTSKNDSKNFATVHEYILCYAKRVEFRQIKGLGFRVPKPGYEEVMSMTKKWRALSTPIEEAETELRTFYKKNKQYKGISQYKHMEKKNGEYLVFRESDVSWPQGEGPTYDVIHPVTKKPCKRPARGWRWKEETMNEILKNDLLVFGEDENKVPQYKRYLHKMDTNLMKSHLSNNENGEVTVRKIFNSKSSYFEHPKPVSLLMYLIQGVQFSNDNIPVLDFFAGSGSTAQAVLELNQEYGGNQQFICVQIPEGTDHKSDAHKAGYKVISDITKERIRRVIEKIEAEQQTTKEKKPQLDLGFKVFKLSDSNLRAWLPQQELNSIQQELDFHAQSPFSDQASNTGIRTEIMLNEGFPLHAHQEQKTMLNQNEVWEIYSEYVPYKLYICLDKHLQEATINQLGSYLNEKDLFICIDAAFGQNNSAKVALAEKCQLRTL